MSRPSSRSNDQMREISIETNVTKHAEGSCMVKCGDTHVLCAATVEEKVPGWMRGIQAKVGSRRNMACCRAQRMSRMGPRGGPRKAIWAYTRNSTSYRSCPARGYVDMDSNWANVRFECRL